MTPIVLAAACAALWGAADFCGGKASQRADAVAVTVVSQLWGLPVLALCLLLVPGVPTATDLAWGGVAGVAGFAGIALLYRALAAGAMVAVAPVTAVTAALVPLGVGLLVDRSPGVVPLVGVGCAILAIALVSAAPGERGGRVTPALIGLALLAGALFGAFTALIGQSSTGAGMWSLAGARLTSLAVGAFVLWRRRTPYRLPAGALPVVAVGGALDLAANALYVAAAARGHLSVVAPIASLYPVSTVLLALAVDRERLRILQLAGLGLAVVALVLTTA
ncbi:MAG TPA: EamA family transporter [Pilimelia sp.]|nr:EamA family transporter [Pilimelia sp.]